jgi:type VI protein secretion system component VasF
MAALRAAVDKAGEHLTPEQRQAVVQETLQQFHLNNTVVAGFSLGWRAVAHAVEVLSAQLPAWVLLGAIGVAGVAGAAGLGLLGMAGGK